MFHFADYFMDRPLIWCTAKELEERLGVLSLILTNGAKIGANRVVIPFVDASAIRDDHDLQAAVETLIAALPLAERTSIELHLETSLPPLEFARLLDRLPSRKSNGITTRATVRRWDIVLPTNSTPMENVSGACMLKIGSFRRYGFPWDRRYGLFCCL